LILRRFSDITESQRSSIVAVAHSSLNQPASWRELLQALDLVEELDDDELDSQVEALAFDVGVIRSRGLPVPNRSRIFRPRRRRSVLGDWCSRGSPRHFHQQNHHRRGKRAPAHCAVGLALKRGGGALIPHRRMLAALHCGRDGGMIP